MFWKVILYIVANFICYYVWFMFIAICFYNEGLNITTTHNAIKYTYIIIVYM